MACTVCYNNILFCFVSGYGNLGGVGPGGVGAGGLGAGGLGAGTTTKH